MGEYAQAAWLKAATDREIAEASEPRPEPEPIEICGVLCEELARREWPHTPCPLPKGHGGFHEHEAL